MTDILLTIDFSDNPIDNSDLETLTRTLYQQLDGMDEIRAVRRLHEVPPTDTKAGDKDSGKPKSGWLELLIDKINVQKIAKFLYTRLSGKHIIIKLEYQGKKLEIDAHSVSQIELESLLTQLQVFFD
jgi:hypothetical protein